MPQPKIQTTLTTTDYIFEAIALISLILLVGYNALNFDEMSNLLDANADKIKPIKGGKMIVWLLPLIGIVYYLVMRFIVRNPQFVKFPVKITEKNTYRQYENGNRMFRAIFALAIVLFCFINFISISAAKGDGFLTGYHVILWILVLLTVAMIYIFWKRSVELK